MTKLELAIENIREGKAGTIEGLSIAIKGNSNIEVTGWTIFSNLHNLNRRLAIEELSQIKVQFSGILTRYPQVAEIIGNRTRQFNLWESDGKGSIAICSELNGVVEWQMDINP